MRSLGFLFPTLLLLTSCATIGLSGGGRTTNMSGSPDLPAAQGTVRTGTSSNGNTRVDISVKHLAPPSKIDPNATVYVVWVKGTEDGASTQSLGALKLNENLEGTLVTVTPLRTFDLMVTPESSQLATSPTGKTVLNARVSM
jgi:hypothetical protein